MIIIAKMPNTTEVWRFYTCVSLSAQHRLAHLQSGEVIICLEQFFRNTQMPASAVLAITREWSDGWPTVGQLPFNQCLEVFSVCPLGLPASSPNRYYLCLFNQSSIMLRPLLVRVCHENPYVGIFMSCEQGNRDPFPEGFSAMRHTDSWGVIIR